MVQLINYIIFLKGIDIVNKQKIFYDEIAIDYKEKYLYQLF